VIRGPVLPQLRASLWPLVKQRLDVIEAGLTAVLEGLDCAEGQLGVVEGLARDAAGAPVLVLLAVDGDALLPARVLAAAHFLRRVGDGLARAIPEGSFCPGNAGRLLVVGTDAAAALLEQVRALPVDALQVCSIESFRIAGSERFAVRWLSVAERSAPERSALPSPSAHVASAPEFIVPPERVPLWQSLAATCRRIDPEVRLHGDRYSRRITWSGQLLGDVRVVDGDLLASAATGVARELRDAHDVRVIADQLLRAYARHAGLDRQPPQPSSAVGRAARPGGSEGTLATRHTVGVRAAPGGSLRSTLAAAKLSPEEYSALGDPASSAGQTAEGTVVAEDVMRSSPSEAARPSASSEN
jgi:hypothetical protein